MEQSDAGCLVHPHFGFGSDPSVLVTSYFWTKPSGGEAENMMLDNGTVWPC